LSSSQKQAAPFVSRVLGSKQTTGRSQGKTYHSSLLILDVYRRRKQKQQLQKSMHHPMSLCLWPVSRVIRAVSETPEGPWFIDLSAVTFRHILARYCLQNNTFAPSRPLPWCTSEIAVQSSG
jgi:hypothetical protein